jgi:hypothetical protein
MNRLIDGFKILTSLIAVINIFYFQEKKIERLKD